jgi:hypothetical protein
LFPLRFCRVMRGQPDESSTLRLRTIIQVGCTPLHILTQFQGMWYLIHLTYVTTIAPQVWVSNSLCSTWSGSFFHPYTCTIVVAASTWHVSDHIFRKTFDRMTQPKLLLNHQPWYYCLVTRWQLKGSSTLDLYK